jgi:hypothetical protein
VERILLTDGVVVNTTVRGGNNGVPVLPVDDPCVRRTRHLLLCLLWGSRVRGIILGVEADFRGSGVFGKYRATVLDSSSHVVVGRNVEAHADLADGGLELLDGRTTKG